MTSVRELFRRFLPAIAAGACIFYFLFVTAPPEPVASIRCSFHAGPEQAPIKLGRYTAPLAELTVTGELSDPFNNRSYDFEGRAEYLIEGKRIKANARGSVFVLEPLPETTSETVHADAVMLTITDADFGRAGLSVDTLDEEGTLNESSDTSYAWTNKDFKLTHPMTMDCAVSPS